MGRAHMTTSAHTDWSMTIRGHQQNVQRRELRILMPLIELSMHTLLLGTLKVHDSTKVIRMEQTPFIMYN